MRVFGFIAILMFFGFGLLGCSAEKLHGLFGSNGSDQPASELPSELLDEFESIPSGTGFSTTNGNLVLRTYTEAERSFDANDPLFLNAQGYWKLDSQTGGYLDYSGNNNHSVNVNNVSDVSGPINGGAEFNGTDSFVEVADDPSLSLGLNLTLSAWVYPTANGQANGSRIISKFVGIADRYALGQPATGHLVFRLQDIATNLWECDSGEPIPLNKWTHVVGMYDGTRMVIFFDGAEIEDCPGPSNLISSTDSLGIGAHIGAPTDRRFQGRIDEVGVWDRDLSYTEIAALYRRHMGSVGSLLPAQEMPPGFGSSESLLWFDTDAMNLNLQFSENNKVNSSVMTSADINQNNGNLGTAGGGVQRSVLGKLGSGVRLDGVVDDIDFGNLSDFNFSFTEGFSFVSWIRVLELPSVGGSDQTLFAKNNENGNNRQWRVYLSQADDKIKLDLSGDGIANETLASDYTLTAGDLRKWIHVAISCSTAKTCLLFVNGRLDSSLTFSIADLNTGSSSFRLGSHRNAVPADVDFFKGIYDETAMFKRALSQDEIETIYERQLENYTAIYTSDIKDSKNNETQWNQIKWKPKLPYGKALPPTLASETGFTSQIPTGLYNNLLLHWAFEESLYSMASLGVGDITDSSLGANYPASIITPDTDFPFYDQGRIGRGIHLDGNGNRLQTANTYDISGQDFSVSLWMQLGFNQNTGNGQHLFSITAGSGRQMDLIVDAGFGGRINFNAYNGCTGGGVDLFGPVANIGRWYHVAVTFEEGVIRRMYIDGEEYSTDVTQTTIPCSANNLFYTARSDVDGSSGILDEVMFWNRVLTPAEVAYLFERGAGKLLFQVRSCDDAACDGEDWQGIDGTNSTFYTDELYSGDSLPEFNLVNVPNNRYFQYRVFFQSTSTKFSPELESVEIVNDR